MSSEPKGLTREPFSLLMRGALATLAVLVIGRLVLELAGMPPDFARYVSSTVGMLIGHLLGGGWPATRRLA